MWSLQAAKNSFSVVVAAALAGRPQYVSRRGHTAVVVSAEDYARLIAASGARRTFVEHLLGQTEGEEAPRAKVTPRDVAF